MTELYDLRRFRCKPAGNPGAPFPVQGALHLPPQLDTLRAPTDISAPMRAARSRSATPLTLSGVLLFAACAPAAPIAPPIFMASPPAPAPAPAARPPERRPRLAVLPIEDDALFRAERALLRFELAGQLVRLAPDHEILPLPEVDAKLRPVSRATGHRCAFEGAPAARRAHDEGWLTTEILHIAGLADGPGEALWVELRGSPRAIAVTFEAPWNSRLAPVDRYRAAFAALVRTEGGGLLGGLAGTGSYEGALREGPLTVCERRSFACDGGSVDWRDRAAEIAACFAGEDDVTEDVLVQGDAGARWCEVEDLHATDGRRGAREACLCRALAASTAMTRRPGRRTVRVRHEAPDLAGKPRPELRVIESSTNVHAEDDWHSMRSITQGKPQYWSVRRLVVDNLDALAAPLARCAAPPGSVIVADLEIREDGVPLGGKVISGAPAPEVAACVENALTRGAFLCTNDGKPARVRVAMEWRAVPSSDRR